MNKKLCLSKDLTPKTLLPENEKPQKYPSCFTLCRFFTQKFPQSLLWSTEEKFLLSVHGGPGSALKSLESMRRAFKKFCVTYWWKVEVRHVLNSNLWSFPTKHAGFGGTAILLMGSLQEQHYVLVQQWFLLACKWISTGAGEEVPEFWVHVHPALWDWTTEVFWSLRLVHIAPQPFHVSALLSRWLQILTDPLILSEPHTGNHPAPSLWNKAFPF